MSSISELSFLQKSQNIKDNILSDLYNIYQSDGTLHSRNKSKCVFKLAQRGSLEFKKVFLQELPQEEYLTKGVSEHLYSLELDAGERFFFSPKTLDFLKELFDKIRENKNLDKSNLDHTAVKI